MKVAIDLSPLKTGHFLQHRVRGTGFYLENLKAGLSEYCSENDYVYFQRGEKLSEDIDVVHYPYFEPFFLTLPFQKKIPSVVTVHDLTPLVFPRHFPPGIKGRVKWLLQKRALLGMDAIVTDSESSKKDVVKFVGINPQRVHVVYLAAGQDFRQVHTASLLKNIKQKYALPDSFVLYVGDATWNKNLPRLIKAVMSVGLPLVMTGKALTEKGVDRNNPWNKDLLEAQHLIEKSPAITLLGFVPTEDLVLLYNAATVFAMPSLYEGFGLPILEAMASGCPVVATKEGSLSEVAGDSAHFVDAYSVDDIGRGIQEVYSDSSLQKKLREKGLTHSKTFRWKKTAEETAKVYTRVCTDGK